MKCVLTNFNEKFLKGWVVLPTGGRLIDLKIELFIRGELVIIDWDYCERPDVSSVERIGCGFQGFTPEPTPLNDIEIFAICNGVRSRINPSESLTFMNSFNERFGDNPISALHNMSPRLLHSLRVAHKNRQRTKDLIRPLAVVTYANGTAGWFDCFYSHYKEMVGSESIYVITAKPHEFSKYVLGGVLGVPGGYDDLSRAGIFSGLSDGLLSYYKYVLIADVDEFLYPPLEYEGSLTEYLSDQDKGSALYSLGMDVFQGEDEPDYVPGVSVYDQRRFGRLNSALFKPSFTRTPLLYSEGTHFCNIPPLSSLDNMPVMMHMKYADRVIRRSVLGVMAETEFTSKENREYVLNDNGTLRMKKLLVSLPSISLQSPEVREFVTMWASRMKYSVDSGMYSSGFLFSDFLVRISEK